MMCSEIFKEVLLFQTFTTILPIKVIKKNFLYDPETKDPEENKLENKTTHCALRKPNKLLIVDKCVREAV